MRKPLSYHSEEDRLEALEYYDILDTEQEDKFDDIVEFLQQEINVPISLISLVDKSRQWFKASKGLDVSETERDISFCGHAILETDIFEVEDASKDPRFLDNPLVTSSPNIRFYAGTQINTDEGLPLGTLCVIDFKPRRLSDSQKKLMKLLAKQVMRLIESGKQKQLLRQHAQIIQSEKVMLEAISALQNAYIKGEDAYIIYSTFLNELLKLTQSEYGFIGEVLTKKDGSSYLKARAITDISWNDETSSWYEQNAPDGLEFSNLDTLFGHVIKTGEVLIANDAPNHPSSGGIPAGHPPLRRFMGVPFKIRGELVGMIGLANRPDNYDSSMLKALSPVLDTCTHIILSQRENEEHRLSSIRLEKEEAKNRRLAEHFNSIYESSRDGIIEVNATDGIITECNQAFCKMLGFKKSELIGREVDHISVEKGHINAAIQRFDMDRSKPDSFSTETQYINKNGHRLPVTIDIFCSVTNEHHAPTVLAMIRDLTEKKEKELKKIQEQKMHSLGSLSGGIAHDFNNILSIILSNSELASLINRNEKVGKRLDAIAGAAIRGAELTSKILAFARKTDVKNEHLKLRDAISESLNLVSSLVPSSISLNATLRDAGYVLSNSNDISQILLNLVSNAVQAIAPNSGVISIDLYCSMSAKEAVLSVQDNGVGIDSHTLEKIFDPFFTTKHQKNGTGLGLATVFAITEELGGNIKVESTIDVGSKFEIRLPIQSNFEPTYNHETTEVTKEVKPLNILVVEDEEAILEAYTEALKARGHNAEGFTAGKHVLQALKTANKNIDVILTDDEMAEMKGTELIKEVTATYSSIGVILVTGNVSDEAQKLQGEGVIHKVVQKPIPLNQLISIVESLLSSSNG